MDTEGMGEGGDGEIQDGVENGGMHHVQVARADYHHLLLWRWRRILSHILTW